MNFSLKRYSHDLAAICRSRAMQQINKAFWSHLPTVTLLDFPRISCISACAIIPAPSTALHFGPFALPPPDRRRRSGVSIEPA
jgi:hypothetical protein